MPGSVQCALQSLHGVEIKVDCVRMDGEGGGALSRRLQLFQGRFGGGVSWGEVRPGLHSDGVDVED